MSFRDFFEAKSVAVVGASREPGKVGHEILQSLIRAKYEGAIYPVNPKAEEIEGIKCYKSLRDTGTVPELVIVTVPAAIVPNVIEECADVGTKSVVVITSGFRETGKKGEELERNIVQMARRYNIRILGPNCLGFMSVKNRLNASFAGDLPVPGSIGMFSQSGSLLAALLDMANVIGVGFSKLVSIGNKADIDELEVIRMLGDDEETKVIAGYLESITDGEAFLRETERISHDKPILLVKSGQTTAGAQAVTSHTGVLAREAAYEVVFERAGVIRCPSIRAQLDFAQALVSQPLPTGPNVAVVANGGGPSILAVDNIERNGLTLAKFTDATTKKLQEGLPPAANIKNPIDVLGDALSNRYEFSIRAAIEDPNVDTVMVMLTSHGVTECEATAEAIIRVSRENKKKPVIACFIGGHKVEKAIKILREGNIPQYETPDSAVDTIRVITEYSRWRSRPKRVVRLFPVNRRKVEQVIDRHLRRNDFEISEMEAKEILEAYGFVIPQGELATNAEQAANIAEQIGYPVVLKIWSPDILHKAQVGGVRTNIKNAQEVMDAFDLMMYRIPKKLPEAEILGVLVERMCTAGHEVFLGMTRDPRFGPLMMFGMGGVRVEVLRDVAFYLAPVTGDEAKEMLKSTQTYRLLQGVPGEEGVDIDTIAEGLQRLSQFVTEFPQAQEVEINPYLVGPEGTVPVAVDARIVLRPTVK